MSDTFLVKIEPGGIRVQIKHQKLIIDKEPPKIEGNNLKYLSALGLGSLALGGGYYLFNKLNNRFSEKFFENINMLKLKYPNQSSYFWKKIESKFVFSILKHGDPATIILVSDNSTSLLSKNLSYDILNTIKISLKNDNNNLDSLIINPTDYQDLIQQKDYDKIKLMIDDKLKKIFLNDNHIALVNNIQKIPATSMMLFYTYSDEKSNAIFSGNIILLTLELNNVIESKTRELFNQNNVNLTKFIKKYMTDLWANEIHPDILNPLITRIGKNILLINNEK